MSKNSLESGLMKFGRLSRRLCANGIVDWKRGGQVRRPRLFLLSSSTFLIEDPVSLPFLHSYIVDLELEIMNWKNSCLLCGT